MKIMPQNNIIIKNGHVFDPSQKLDGVMDIYIENDRIVALAKAPQGFVASETIDASDKMIFPGFIDLNAFIGEPGRTHRGNMQTETLAAARSGFTSICSTPDSKPVVDSAAVASLIQDKARDAGYCQVLPIGALTANLEGEQLSNMSSLKDAGCIALGNLEYTFKDSHVIKQCYHYAAGFDITVMVTPLDVALANEGYMHEGPTSTQLGLAGIPESAETASLAQHLILCEETGVKLHISRITSKRALEMILTAQERGLPVTCDVALGNLIFTDEDCKGYNSLMHVTPCYRSSKDRQALLDAVNAGHIAICSNHKPHDLAAKMAPFSATLSGISVLDSFSGVLFDLVKQNKLTLKAAIQAVSSAPAAILGLGQGSIEVEKSASLCIVDLDQSITLTAKDLASKGNNNPWLNKALSGKVVCTINQGHIVYQV